MIGNKMGYLMFIDYADTSLRGDCFTFVKLLYGFQKLNDALKLIDKDFGLGISSEPTGDNYKKIVAEYKQPEMIKRNAIIQVKVRKFTNEELAYWNQYHQSIEIGRAHV